MKFFPLNHSHIPEIMAIENAAHLTPWTEKIVQQSFGSKTENFGAFAKVNNCDVLLGYVFCQYVAGELSLENICVAPENQGKHIGQQLMAELIFKGKLLNADCIWLEVRASNASAIALYRNSGFEQIAIRKNYYQIPNSNSKEDALLMKLSLSS